MNYNYYRDYDPATGRYIESDPIGLIGGINTFTYVGGKVLKHRDSRGLLSDEDWERRKNLKLPGQQCWDKHAERGQVFHYHMMLKDLTPFLFLCMTWRNVMQESDRQAVEQTQDKDRKVPKVILFEIAVAVLLLVVFTWFGK